MLEDNAQHMHDKDPASRPSSCRPFHLGKMREAVKVAAVQAAPIAFDLAKSIAKVEAFTAQAASNGADLVVFPEAFLSAYPWRYAFDATIGAREPRGRTWYARYYNSSLAIPSPEYDTLVETARVNNVLLQVGIVERDGATLYCTSLLLGRDGEMLTRHRKVGSRERCRSDYY